MKFIVVDDEPMALDVMTDYASKLDFLECAGTFRDAVSALSFLNRHRVDLVLLDINMPGITGLQMLKTLERPPLVIITTAYSEYALEGYRFNVVDYLMKPVDFELFLRAVNRANDLFLLKNKMPEGVLSTGRENNQETDTFNDEYWVKSGTEYVRLQLSEIRYIKSESNYVEYYLSGKKVMVLDSLNRLSQSLPSSMFIRIHKSYIAGLHHIKSIERHQVRIDDTTIPVGQSYRQSLLAITGKI